MSVSLGSLGACAKITILILVDPFKPAKQWIVYREMYEPLRSRRSLYVPPILYCDSDN